MRVKNILRTGIFNLLFQLGFLILMFAVGGRVSLTIINSGSSRFIVLAAVILLLSLVWALFFYWQDRREPEPFSYIIFSFIAGMAAAALAAAPLFNIVFQVQRWIYSSTLLFVLGSFFVTAAIVNLLLYIVIRLGFYPLEEFDEPVDGMVYGAIAGAGFACVQSLYYLSARPSFTLFVIAYTAAANILIYSGVGSIMGYIIGRAKFQGTNVQRSSAFGVAAGTVVLGIYFLFNEFIFISGFDHAFWLSFILTSIYSFLILLFCYLKMRKLTRKDRPVHKKAATAANFDLRMGLLIIILLAAAAVIANRGLQGKKFVHPTYGISFYYPHNLSSFSFNGISQIPLPAAGKSEILFSGESGSPPYFSFSASVHAAETGDNDTDADKHRRLMQYVGVTDTRGLTVTGTVVGGQKGTRIAYSYIDKAPGTDTGIEVTLPVFIHIYTDIVDFDRYTFIFTYKAASEHFKEGLPRYAAILGSVKWKQL